MKEHEILIFTEGTILMHKNAIGLNSFMVVKQVKEHESSVKNYSEYVPNNLC